jgi:ActR/RegA family two-component response regulator
MATDRELSPVALDLDPLLELVDDENVFLDQLERLLFGGNMSVSTRESLADAMNELASSPNEDRVKLALYLALISPEQAVFGDAQ